MLPGKLTSTVYYQFTPTTKGIFGYIQSVLDIKMAREFLVTEVEGGNGLKLVERVGIECNKIVLGSVKDQYIEDWKRFYWALIEKMDTTADVQT